MFMPVLAVTRVGKYYRTTVPREVRKILELREEDSIEWFSKEGKYLSGRREAMVKCPYCGYEAETSGFKLLKGPWRFRFYEVKMFECPKCLKVFNYYYGVSPRSGRVSEFTIKVRPRRKSEEAS